MKILQIVIANILALLLLDAVVLRAFVGVVLPSLGPDVTSKLAIPLMASLMCYVWLVLYVVFAVRPVALWLIRRWKRFLAWLKVRSKATA